MTVFDQYARYYDLLYRDKRYDSEAQFMHGLLWREGSRTQSLFEMGSGTGRHAIEFAKLGWVVDGIDLSPEMVRLARERVWKQHPDLVDRIGFAVGDVREAKPAKEYDAVVSLFHVMSYQRNYADLISAIGTAAQHLKPGGKFFFDFWYGAAVLSDPPANRTKCLEDDLIEVSRFARPESLYSECLVKVAYSIQIKSKETGALSEIAEEHTLRYWFLPELEYFLGDGGFRLLGSGACYTHEPLSPKTWYGWALAEKTDALPRSAAVA